MDNFSYNLPAMLFPTISLFFLSFTNRFVAMSQLTPSLCSQYQTLPNQKTLSEIKNMKFRLNLLKNTQILGIFSLIFTTFSVIFLFFAKPDLSKLSFGLSLLLLIMALFCTAWEIIISTEALEIELSDLEKLLPK